MTRGLLHPIMQAGKWQHGWQHQASSTSEFHFRETVLPSLAPQTRPSCGLEFKVTPSQCFFEGVAGLWPATFSPKEKNTDVFVLLCLPASFLTFGKVNPGPPQSAFVLARRPS